MALEIIVCVAFLVYGSVILFAYCISPIVATNRKLILSAIISAVVGVFLIFVRSFFIVVLAMFVLYFAIFKTIVLNKAKENKNFNWIIWLIISIVHFIVGVIAIIFFALNKFIAISMILIGVSLILESIGNIVVFLRNQKIIEEINKSNNSEK